MRYLYDVTVVDKKTDEVLLDKKVAASDDVSAVLKASSGQVLDQRKVDIVIKRIAELSKEPTKVVVEKE